MNKKIIIAVVVIVTVSGFYLLQNPREVRGEMKVYMGGNCGCCEIYANIMRRNYDVEEIVLSNEEMVDFKSESGVPDSLYSCHTTVIDGYVVEGHVPMEAIEVLREGSDLKGIGMAGMPQGSPGMPGSQTEPFRIYEITSSEEVGDLFLEL